MNRQSFFLYYSKVKKYNVNLMNQNQSEPIRTQAFQGVYLWINEEMEHDEKVTLTPE